MNPAIDFFGGQPQVLNTEHKLFEIQTATNLQREVDTVAHLDDDTGEVNYEGLRNWFVAQGLIRGYREIHIEMLPNCGEFGSIEISVDGVPTYLIMYLD